MFQECILKGGAGLHTLEVRELKGRVGGLEAQEIVNIGGPIGQIIRRPVDFLGFLMILVGLLWFLIIPKWPIKASGHIPILFGTFLELQKMAPNLVHGPPSYYKNILKI